MAMLRLLILLVLVWTASLLGGCSQSNSGDQTASSTAGEPVGIQQFLVFPNPVVQAGGSFQTTATAYAQAYYAAVDPGSQKTTLAAWQGANGFGGGQEHTVVFRDVRDLGYGRRMTGHYEPGGRIAFFVENYQVSAPGGGYQTINVDAAVARDSKWHIGTNAIEWSCDPQPTPCAVKFAKYYSFSPSGQRQLTVDMDGRGQKAMPGPCITCHGGRGDPLDPAATFTVVANSGSGVSGDVQGKLHGFNVDSFEWSTTAGFTRADQEANLKDFNQWVLCTYPTPSGSGGLTEPNGCVRADAGPNDWQAVYASATINAWYNNQIGVAGTKFSDTYLPAGWAGSANLYGQVVAPYCRTCHIVRGTANENDIDFSSETTFLSYADRIKVHVYDRGNMPLALLVYQAFWSSLAPQTLADYLNSKGKGPATAANGTRLQPGRPIADPGPPRSVAAGKSATLYGGDSLFATSYSWSVQNIGAPGTSASISNPSSAVASLLATDVGSSYTVTVRLTVTGGSQSDFKDVVLAVDPSFPDPAGIRFVNVKNELTNIVHNDTKKCVDCHFLGISPGGGNPPIVYDNPDDNSFLQELRGRANLTEIAASPLLRKPTGKHHHGNKFPGVTQAPLDTATPAGLTSFSKLYYWIVNGMPAGGVAANFVAPTAPVVTFNTSVPSTTPAITLNGTSSIGATTYTWSILPSPAPPAGATIVTTGLGTANLVPINVGTYAVQLQVSNGTDTDTTTHTIIVDETPVTASFTPATGNVTFPFLSLPSSASVTLTASTTGNPTVCSWVVAPVGPTFGSAASCTSTTMTASSATIGTQYTVTFTANNVTKQGTATNLLTVQAPLGSSPTGANFTFGSPKIGFTVNNNLANTPSAVMSGNTLSGSVTGGLPTLTYAWSASNNGASGCAVTSPGQTATVTATSVGNCDVTLTVSNGILPNSTRTLTVPITSSVVLSNVASILGSAGCTTGCHTSGGSATPSWDNDGGLAARLATVIDVTPKLSLLLVCPSVGGQPACSGMPKPQSGFGGGDFSNYDAFLTWIINGTP